MAPSRTVPARGAFPAPRPRRVGFEPAAGGRQLRYRPRPSPRPAARWPASFPRRRQRHVEYDWWPL